MLKASLESCPEANRALLGEFKIQEDVKMYTQLPDCDNIHRFDLSSEMDLSAISKRIPDGLSKLPC